MAATTVAKRHDLMAAGVSLRPLPGSPDAVRRRQIEPFEIRGDCPALAWRRIGRPEVGSSDASDQVRQAEGGDNAVMMDAPFGLGAARRPGFRRQAGPDRKNRVFPLTTDAALGDCSRRKHGERPTEVFRKPGPREAGFFISGAQ